MESLRIDADLAEPGLRLTRLRRVDLSGSVGCGQPPVWTLLDFEAAEERAEALAAALAAVLLREGGWYADFHGGGERYVIFAGRSFRYPEGDAAGREEAVAYGEASACRRVSSTGAECPGPGRGLVADQMVNID